MGNLMSKKKSELNFTNGGYIKQLAPKYLITSKTSNLIDVAQNPADNKGDPLGGYANALKEYSLIGITDYNYVLVLLSMIVAVYSAWEAQGGDADLGEIKSLNTNLGYIIDTTNAMLNDQHFANILFNILLGAGWAIKKEMNKCTTLQDLMRILSKEKYSGKSNAFIRRAYYITPWRINKEKILTLLRGLGKMFTGKCKQAIDTGRAQAANVYVATEVGDAIYITQELVSENQTDQLYTRGHINVLYVIDRSDLKKTLRFIQLMPDDERNTISKYLVDLNRLTDLFRQIKKPILSKYPGRFNYDDNKLSYGYLCAWDIIDKGILMSKEEQSDTLNATEQKLVDFVYSLVEKYPFPDEAKDIKEALKELTDQYEKSESLGSKVKNKIGDWRNKLKSRFSKVTKTNDTGGGEIPTEEEEEEEENE